MTDVMILGGARTPFAVWAKGERPDGQKGGALAALDPFDLGAAALKGALEKSGVPGDRLERLAFGNCYHVGPHACYGARYVGLRAGLPESLTGVTVNLACGAGLQALLSAADDVADGRARLAAAVGADSSSNVPRNVFVPSFKDVSCGQNIAETAQAVARELGFSRDEQDAWALRSHRRAALARQKGWLAEEIVPTGGASADDAIREQASEEFFAQSKRLYETGDATHGNTHAIVDGGSALVLAAPGQAAGRQVLGRYVGGAVAGVPPARMAEGSVAAIRKLLAQLKLSAADVDLFEINETFASQMIIGVKELGLDPEKVNVNGGALALGHPFGGTGGRLVLTLLKELKRRGLKRGVASICVGAGLGIAAAVEAV